MDVNTQLMSNMSFRGSHDRLGQDFNKSEKGGLKHGDEGFSVCLRSSCNIVQLRFNEWTWSRVNTDRWCHPDRSDRQWVMSLVVIHCWTLWVHIKQSCRASVSLSHNIWANGLSSPDSSLMFRFCSLTDIWEYLLYILFWLAAGGPLIPDTRHKLKRVIKETSFFLSMEVFYL